VYERDISAKFLCDGMLGRGRLIWSVVTKMVAWIYVGAYLFFAAFIYHFNYIYPFESRAFDKFTAHK